jgi:hypothetical protein
MSDFVGLQSEIVQRFWLGLFTVHFASVGLNDFWKVEFVFGSPATEDTNYVFKVLAIYGKAASTGVYDLSENFLIAAIGLWAPLLFFKLDSFANYSTPVSCGWPQLSPRSCFTPSTS